MENIDEFTKQIGLSEEQSLAVKKYIKELLLDTLESMKDEFNSEVDNAIKDLNTVKIDK